MWKALWRSTGILLLLAGLVAMAYLYSGRVNWGDEHAVWNVRTGAGVGIFLGISLIASSFRKTPQGEN